MTDPNPARLLPWAVEATQLDMAGDLLEHAADLLADRRATPDQLRYVLARMSEALTDVRRIAVSRGAGP